MKSQRVRWMRLVFVSIAEGKIMPKGVYIRISTLCSIEGCNEKHYGKGLCYKCYQKQYQQDNKECLAMYKKQYQKDNKEKITKSNKQCYLENKEKINKRNRQWYKDNKEHCSEYYQDNREYISKRAKKYHSKNKEHLTEYLKQWKQTPIGRASIKADCHNRRAMTRDLTKETVQRVYEDNIKQFGTLTCVLCFKPVEFKDSSLDHLTPLSRGGSNDYDNFGVAHFKCNMKKQAMTLDEWFAKTENNVKEGLWNIYQETMRY